MIFLNALLMVIGWWVADLVPRWSGQWWINVVASAANGACVLNALL